MGIFLPTPVEKAAIISHQNGFNVFQISWPQLLTLGLYQLQCFPKFSYTLQLLHLKLFQVEKY